MHGDPGSPNMVLLPTWLRVGWVVALCAVLVVHVGHLAAISGQRRGWHTTHAIMAAGMALMYLLPRMEHPGLYRAGLALFAVMVLTTAVVAAVLRLREGALNPLWLLSIADLAAMAYMLAPPAIRPDWLNWTVAAYLGCQALAWVFGLWNRLPVLRDHTPTDVFPAQRDPSGPASEHDPQERHTPTSLAADPVPEAATRPPLGLRAHSTVSVRVTLAVMAAGMAYMLTAM